MRFFEYRFSPVRDETESALLTAFLLELGFDSFTEEEKELIAYRLSDLSSEEPVGYSRFNEHFPGIQYSYKSMENKNWNEEWEKNYEPVLIAGKCYVRAPFHPSRPDADYEITIEPKMAFGTAHHETTQLVAGWMTELNLTGLTVLDMGCGTGVLAILANKMGASNVMGIDNDEWAERNAVENFRLNRVTNGDVVLGDARDIATERYDLILANINRNILLNDMAHYAAGLKPGARIIFSGFYDDDSKAITGAAESSGLQFLGARSLNKWAAMLFMKKQA